MADARTTLGGPSIGVGGGSSYGRRDTSGHERVQAQRAEANTREQEARRLGTWKEGVGVINKQQLAAEARDKAFWEQNRAAQNQTSMATPPVRNEYDEAGTGMTPEQQNAADANKRKAQEQAYNPRTFQDRQQNAMISAVQEARNAQQMRPATPRPFMGSTAGDVPENRMGVPGASRYADATQGVVPIDPAHQVLAPYSKISYAPFGYAGSPAFRSGQMVRATSAPITNAFGKQTGIAGATRNNWQQAVMAAHPEIGQKGSEFNKRYVQAVKAQTGEFDPMKLASDIKQGMTAETSGAKLIGPEGSRQRALYNQAVKQHVDKDFGEVVGDVNDSGEGGYIKGGNIPFNPEKAGAAALAQSQKESSALNKANTNPLTGQQFQDVAGNAGQSYAPQINAFNPAKGSAQIFENGKLKYYQSGWGVSSNMVRINPDGTHEVIGTMKDGQMQSNRPLTQQFNRATPQELEKIREMRRKTQESLYPKPLQPESVNKQKINPLLG